MTIHKIYGIGLILLGIMMVLSLASYTDTDWPQVSSAAAVENWCGRFGAILSFYAIFFFGRAAAWLWPAGVLAWGSLAIAQPAPDRSAGRIFLSFMLILSFVCGMLYMIWSGPGSPGGTMGWWLNERLQFFGGGGTTLILFCAGVIGSASLLPSSILFRIKNAVGSAPGQLKAAALARVARWRADRDRKHEPIPVQTASVSVPVEKTVAKEKQTADAAAFVRDKPAVDSRADADSASAQAPVGSKAIAFPVKSKEAEKPSAVKSGVTAESIAEANETPEDREFRQALAKYRLPPLELLKWPPETASESRVDDERQLQATAQILENTMKNFGIDAQVTNIVPGPTVTLYEVLPAVGVQVGKIAAREAELKMALAAISIRILAPIPGKSVVGVEVPNPKPQLVKIRELLALANFSPGACTLPFALGKDILSKPVVVDLQKMPHVLIAGATGSGKSVCIASLLITLLCRLTPAQLRLILIDPKRVELSLYSDIPHLLHPPILDAKLAAESFKWLQVEMESRYNLLQDSGQKNIEGYNAEQARLGMSPMPYIVLVVDELADLILTERRTVESAITRLSQMSRAVGIHLVLATQRPSVDVITGLIKANMPSRIAFQVISQVDSRTILDAKGADELMGRGDMLYLAPGALKPVRLQGAFVDEEEIHRIVDFIRGQMRPMYVDFESVPENLMAAVGAGSGGGLDTDVIDPKLYEEAKRFIIQIRKGSTAMLQKKFRVGFNRAQRMIEMMEKDGIVGPNKGPTPRDVLVKSSHMDSGEEADRG